MLPLLADESVDISQLEVEFAFEGTRAGISGNKPSLLGASRGVIVVR